MSEFKKQVYMQFYPDAWLNSQEVRRLKPDVKGFYMDFMCHVFSGFPHGHCSILNNKKAKKLQKLDNLRVNHVVIKEDNYEDSLWADLTLNFSVSRQLSVVDNLEEELYKFIPYTPQQIIDYIRVLEENRVISRTTTGVLFVRRMVKDFKRKVVAYLNGSKGGNKKLKKSKKGKVLDQNDVSNVMSNKPLQDLVTGVGVPNGSYSLPVLPQGKDKGDYKGEKRSHSVEISPPIFQLQQLYEKTWEELTSQPAKDMPGGLIKGLTHDGFIKWKQFIDWVIENGFEGLWKAHPLGPADFQKLYFFKNFTEEWWKPTIEKILSTGLEPKHVLFFRIPEFMKHVNSSRSGPKNTSSGMNAGDTNFKEQQQW